MIAALHGDDARVAGVLAEIGSPEGLAALRRHEADADAELRLAVTTALLSQGHPPAPGAVEGLLDDLRTRWRLRHYVDTWLRELGLRPPLPGSALAERLASLGYPGSADVPWSPLPPAEEHIGYEDWFLHREFGEDRDALFPSVIRTLGVVEIASVPDFGQPGRLHLFAVVHEDGSKALGFLLFCMSGEHVHHEHSGVLSAQPDRLLSASGGQVKLDQPLEALAAAVLLQIPQPVGAPPSGRST